MSRRSVRATEFEERDHLPPPRRSNLDFDDLEYRSRAPRPRVATREMDEVDVRVQREDRTPAFLRDDGRRSEAGPIVLRKRDVEVYDRHNPRRSPSPSRSMRDFPRRPKSVSPPSFRDEHDHVRSRVVERERVRHRSPSAPPVRFVRARSPSPVEERIRTRIVEKEKERLPSPSPSPPPPPIIRGPTIEREVITHWTDVDHGVVRARPPSPPPLPRARARERETDIDISLSKNRTEVDIYRSSSRARSKSRDPRSRYHEDDVVVRRDNERIRVDDNYSGSRRRAQSAAPSSIPFDDEADQITSKIDNRGRMGEARSGATRDWTIVDVPPGTERVRMDGIGGASTDTTWERYSGVRRTQFIPERDGVLVPREPSPARDRSSVAIYDREREIDVDIDRRITRTPMPPPPPPPPAKDMWTEITKDLVMREAIEELGYDYEETREFFYIMDYLKYDDVCELTERSDAIRRARKDRVREIQWERDWRDDWERPFRRHHHRDHHDHWRSSREEWDDERVREREVVFDSRRPNYGYLR